MTLGHLEKCSIMAVASGAKQNYCFFFFKPFLKYAAGYFGAALSKLTLVYIVIF